MDSYQEAIFNALEPEAERLQKKYCTTKRPDKTPMTNARKLALKKGELLRTYCNIISQMHRIQRLAGDIERMDGEGKKVVNASGMYYLYSSVEFLTAAENELRRDLGQISKEESRQRADARSDRKHIKYLQKKCGKENVAL